MTSAQEQRFVQLLTEHRSEIVKAWQQAIVNSYPEKTAQFLTSQKDQFANPIGATISREVGVVFDELLLEESTERLSTSIDALLRIRAVQDFPPSRAVAFFQVIKKIVRRQAGAQIQEQGLLNELAGFDDKVDQTCLLAFDVYMQCREKIWELRAKESQYRVSNLLKRMTRMQGEEPSE